MLILFGVFFKSPSSKSINYRNFRYDADDVRQKAELFVQDGVDDKDFMYSELHSSALEDEYEDDDNDEEDEEHHDEEVVDSAEMHNG